MIIRSTISRAVSFALVILLSGWGSQLFSLADDLAGTNRHSLQFRIDPGFRLDSFRGSLLSYQFDLTSSFSLRLGLSYYQDDSSVDLVYHLAWDPYTPYEFTNYYLNRSGSYYFDVIRYHRDARFSLYYGIGAYLTYAELIDEDSYVNTWSQDSTIRISSDVNHFSGTGGSILFGSDWRILDWLSIHAEYSTLVYYRREEVTRVNEEIPFDGRDREYRETKGWKIYSQGVRFGVSFRF